MGKSSKKRLIYDNKDSIFAWKVFCLEWSFIVQLEMNLELPEAKKTGKGKLFGSGKNNQSSDSRVIRFIDLFAGMGGTRLGFEQACQDLGLKHACTFTSEIKNHAVKAYSENFADDRIAGDITAIDPKNIPAFDFLLAGFPCQPFSAAGKRKGLRDDRGNLFFTIVDILQAKRPTGFLLENVDGLVTDNDGQTMAMIEHELCALGYKISWRVLNAADFGVPQQRKRLYITGHLSRTTDLAGFGPVIKTCGVAIENNIFDRPMPFGQTLRKYFSHQELLGKSIKDKRGGESNIHSWDIEYKGAVTHAQKQLLKAMMTQRRQKKWAIAKGMDWMDGMPLTHDEIATFFPHKDLQAMLDDLVAKKYIKFEHPKSLHIKDGIRSRIPDPRIPKGYNIVTGKLSFPLTKILHPDEFAPTLVATEAGKMGVSLPQGVRPITIREGLRLSGFPDNYALNSISYKEAFDLLGNTVMPPVITAVAKRLLA
jgi:DNA (cytosine-5)-methyltransferase 1